MTQGATQSEPSSGRNLVLDVLAEQGIVPAAEVGALQANYRLAW